jgi:steroid delta-isomerase-like uncharacterized protein
MADRELVRQIAESWVDAYNRKDYGRLKEIIADDFVLADHGLGLTLEGGEKFVQGIRGVAETDIPDRRLTAKRFMVDGDTAIIEGSWHGTVKAERWGLPPGSVRRHKSCTLLDIRDGQIIRMTDYTCDEH